MYSRKNDDPLQWLQILAEDVGMPEIEMDEAKDLLKATESPEQTTLVYEHSG